MRDRSRTANEGRRAEDRRREVGRRGEERHESVRKAIRSELADDAPGEGVRRPPPHDGGPRPVVELDHVSLAFDDPILEDVSFTANEGETFVIAGESGTGKSTILKLVLRLLVPDSGEVRIDGDDVTSLSFDDALEVRQKMGMVFQGAALFDSMNVFENVAYPLREHTDFDEQEIEERVREKLQFVDLDPERVMEQLPAELSGGMRKRVGIARGMANNPELMLYDEPTSGLDPLTTGTITRLIMKLQRELGVTSLVVSHDLRAAFRMGSKIALLHERKIGFIGTPEEMAASEDEYIRSFLGGLCAMKRSSFLTWDQLKVGMLIAGALLVLAVAVYRLGQATSLFSRRYDLYAYVREANGLRVGGSVLVAGQFAGTIKAIEFLPVDNDTTHNLRIKMAVDHKLQPQIRSDSKAHVRTLGLLGDKVIDISTGTPRYGELKAGDTLAVIPALDYEAMLAQAAGAVNDVVGLTRDLRQITSSIVNGEGTIGQLMTNRALYDKFVGTMGRANTVMSRLENPNGTIGRFLNDPTAYNKLVAVVGTADSLVKSLNATVNDRNGTIGRLMHDDSLYIHLVNMAAAGDSLIRALSNGNGLAGRLLNDPEMYDRVNKVTTDLAALLTDVRKNPREYFKGVVCVFRCK